MILAGFYTDDPIVLRHLLRGVELLERECRQAGMRLPPDVIEARGDLARLLQVPGGTNGTPEGGAGATLIDVDETAVRLGVSESYVRRLARDGVLVAFRGRGGRWAVDPTSVAEHERCREGMGSR